MNIKDTIIEALRPSVGLVGNDQWSKHPGRVDHFKGSSFKHTHDQLTKLWGYTYNREGLMPHQHSFIKIRPDNTVHEIYATTKGGTVDYSAPHNYHSLEGRKSFVQPKEPVPLRTDDVH